MPRNHRTMPYRPPRETADSGAAGWADYVRFARRYLYPYRKRIGACILLVSLNACSIYLMAYYGRVVVDDVLVVTAEPTHPVSVAAERSTVSAGEHEPAVQDLPAHGVMSEQRRDIETSGRPPGAAGKLMTLFVVYLSTMLLLNVSVRIAERLRIRISQQITARLREDTHEKILALQQSFHQAHPPGRLMARILSDVDVVQHQMMQTLLTASSQIVMFLVGSVLLLTLAPGVAVCAFSVMIPYAYLIHRMHHRMRTVNREIRHTNTCLWGLASQKLDSMRAIFAYHREKHEILNFHRLSACFLRDTIEQQRLGAGLNRSATIIISTTTLGVFIYCASQVIQGHLTLGKMMYIYGTSASLFSPVLALTQMSLMISSLLVVLQRLTRVFDEPLQVVESPKAVGFPRKLHAGIAVRHVTFNYSSDGDAILRDVNMNLPAGKWACIMGPSGSGKTTLLNLLARLYDPTEGDILVDGISLAGIKFASLRRHLALVPQEPQIFRGTVRDNITYGYPDAEPEEIMAAAKAAECHDFIMDLPVKYETTVGEKGSTLSGGQRQRLSIARALLTNPEVLLLDDCTSALDAETERRLQQTLSGLLVGKTAVIVSQRVSMAMRCDRIYVLEDGAITEAGKHEELVARGGFYSRLYAQQTE